VASIVDLRIFWQPGSILLMFGIAMIVMFLSQKISSS